MQGFRRAAVHLALVALFLRAFLPAGWMPGAPGDAFLVLCSVAPIHDTADGKAPADKTDHGGECAFAGTPALGAPEQTISFLPVLQSYIRQDQTAPALRNLTPGHVRPAPRAPPASA